MILLYYYKGSEVEAEELETGTGKVVFSTPIYSSPSLVMT